MPEDTDTPAPTPPPAEPTGWALAMRQTKALSATLAALRTDGTETGRTLAAHAGQALGQVLRDLNEARQSILLEQEHVAKTNLARAEGAEARKRVAEGRLAAAHAELQQAEAELRKVGA